MLTLLCCFACIAAQAEVFEHKCEVVAGELPAELDGVFMRNGSNPYYDPYAGYHWWASADITNGGLLVVVNKQPCVGAGSATVTV